MSRHAITIAASLVIIGAFLLAVKRWSYPYGARPCQLPCTMSALKTFALEHKGCYPNISNAPYLSLQLLYPNYLEAKKLSGLSGNIDETRRRLLRSLPLDSAVCSWVYFPGFRSDDPANLMIIMEAKSGVGFNGFRGAAGSHAVGFASGEFRQVSSDKWDGFMQEQARLRAEVIASRSSKNERRKRTKVNDPRQP